MSGVLAAVAGDAVWGVNPLFDTSVADIAIDPLDATANLRFNSDGSTTVTGLGTGGTAPKTWFTGTPSGWSIQRTVNTGSLNTDPGAGWIALSANRTFGCTRTSTGTNTANVTFAFSPDGGVSTLASRTVVFQAQVEI